MIHDPMCPSFDGSDNHYCECDLIARVREDERKNRPSWRARAKALAVVEAEVRAAALRDAVEAVKALHDDANAKRIISGKREPDDDYYWALDDSVAAIEELGGNNGH